MNFNSLNSYYKDMYFNNIYAFSLSQIVVYIGSGNGKQ